MCNPRMVIAHIDIYIESSSTPKTNNSDMYYSHMMGLFGDCPLRSMFVKPRTKASDSPIKESPIDDELDVEQLIQLCIPSSDDSDVA